VTRLVRSANDATSGWLTIASTFAMVSVRPTSALLNPRASKVTEAKLITQQ
jgi:hypothetical protein